MFDGLPDDLGRGPGRGRGRRPAGRSGGDEPAQPGGELRPQRDRRPTPGMWPAAKSVDRADVDDRPRRRRSRALAPRSTVSGAASRSRVEQRRAAPVDLRRAAGSRAGSCRAPPSSCATKASSSGRPAAGWWPSRAPMVVVRSAPGGAEQNDPAPWVGHTAAASGSAAAGAASAYWARASASVGRGRSGRCGRPRRRAATRR